MYSTPSKQSLVEITTPPKAAKKNGVLTLNFQNLIYVCDNSLNVSMNLEVMSRSCIVS